MKPTIESLRKAEYAFCEAAVALRKIQEELGFKPGASVHAVSRWPEFKHPHGDGTIAPYGPQWRDTNHLHIPVVFNDGKFGLYRASDMTLPA